MLVAVGFVPDTHASTATDFRRAADENARAFYFWVVSTAIVWWGASLWWASVPGMVAIHASVCWLSCKQNAQRLRGVWSQNQARRYQRPWRSETIRPRTTRPSRARRAVS